MSAPRYLIVGDGPAGVIAAQELRRGRPQSTVTIVSDDPHPTYYRAALTNYLLGELRDEHLWSVRPSFFGDSRIERVYDRVAAVELREARVRLEGSRGTLPYDGMLVASGARPRPAGFAGGDLAGVTTLRTLRDVRAMLDLVLLGSTKGAVVIGGGPLALEWAMALREHKLEVTLIVRGAQVLEGVLDRTASDLVVARMKARGVQVRMEDEVVLAAPGASGRVRFVRTRQGAEIPCELVGVAIGVVPNAPFLAGTGMQAGRRGGVPVDRFMRTSVPNIFAAGDVAETATGAPMLWEPAQVQGEIAAANLLGGDRAYAPSAHYFATRLADLDFACVSRPTGNGRVEELVDRSESAGGMAYRRLVLEDGKLVSVLLLGERRERVRARGRDYRSLLEENVDVSPIRSQLFDARFDLHAWIENRHRVTKPKRVEMLEARGVAPVASPSKMRASQFMRAEDLKAPRESRAATASPPRLSSPRPQMLSVGFPMPSPAAAARAGGGTLVLGERSWPITETVVTIGRHASSTVALEDPSVSQSHAQITEGAGGLFVRDLGSRNGTFANGALVTVPHALQGGDRIRVGETELTFLDGAGATLRPPPGLRPPSNRPPSPGPSIGSPPLAPQSMPLPAPNGVPTLVVDAGPDAGVVHLLTATPLRLGREADCTLRFSDAAVSRYHAELVERDGRWALQDLGSSHGTFRNGARLAPRVWTPLAHGDRLQLGQSFMVLRLR